jgi:hypothetical protein
MLPETAAAPDNILPEPRVASWTPAETPFPAACHRECAYTLLVHRMAGLAVSRIIHRRVIPLMWVVMRTSPQKSGAERMIG